MWWHRSCRQVMNDTAIAEKKNMNLAGSKIELTALEERHWGKFLQWHVFCKLYTIISYYSWNISTPEPHHV